MQNSKNKVLEGWKIDEHKVYAAVLAKIVREKLRGLSIHIDEIHFKELSARIYSHISESESEIAFPKSILELAEMSGHKGLLTIDVGGYDDDQLRELYEDTVSELVNDAQDETSQKIYTQNYSQIARRLRKRKKGLKLFLSAHTNNWRETLDLLENFFLVCFDIGSKFNDEIRPGLSSDDYLLDALTRSHARACQVSFEILVLLRAGFADGAHARWRTLHEIAVITCFLNNHGNSMAERYLSYGRIQSYSDAKVHRENYRGIGEQPLSDEEFEKLTNEKENLENKFGKEFSRPNGWAYPVLADTRFTNIERSVGMNHLRPYYRMANINVHAGSTGLYFRLGQAGDYLETILAGPSSLGIIDPASGAAISMAQITTFTLMDRLSFDRLASLKALQILLDNLHSEFQKLVTPNVDG